MAKPSPVASVCAIDRPLWRYGFVTLFQLLVTVPDVAEDQPLAIFLPLVNKDSFAIPACDRPVLFRNIHGGIHPLVESILAHYKILQRHLLPVSFVARKIVVHPLPNVAATGDERPARLQYLSILVVHRHDTICDI